MHSLPEAVLQDPASIADALGSVGACRISAFPDAQANPALRGRLLELKAQGGLRAAEVGHGAGLLLRSEVRGDSTHWLEQDTGMATSAYLAALDELRVALNRQLFLGMEEVEAHFACYAPGAFYRRHSDRFHDSDARVLSLVSYFNEDWQPEHGGALRLYLPQGTVDVLPQAGTSLCFLSQIEHEVLPTTRERLSIAAWMRTRPR